jgi:hypothetical protein
MTDLGPDQHRPPVDAAQRAVARLEQLRSQPPGAPAPTVAPVASL